MRRKSRVADTLKQICADISFSSIQEGYEGVSAQQLSEFMGMDRANVSKELNQLFQEDAVIKITGRPVYYFDRERMEELLAHPLDTCTVPSLQDFLQGHRQDTENDFDKLIGSDKSLKTMINKAKAAMIYPPFGLHTLLVGPTGAGKTMFAEIMYQYAKDHGVLNKTAPFVIFNCAEYADNPQLLLGQLFGYVKGAYTGAERENEGLVEKAQNGVLFLDEIHRLPPEGQEMLFMLLDKGEYRKLGANETSKDARVLIIAATTENLESSLLQTFLRRIPMTITMPSLEDRSIEERYELIEKFFRQEYNQVKIPIHVKAKVMRALLSYDCKGNIGQLKADIRLLCANGFLEHISRQDEVIRITLSLLQEHIYHGLLNSGKQKEVDDFLTMHDQDVFVYDQETKLERYDGEFLNIYEEMNRRFQDYEAKGYDNTKINHHMRTYIETYIKTLSNQIEESGSEAMLYKIVPIHVYHAVEVALQLAQQRLGYPISKKVYTAMALHISALLENKRKEHELNPNVYDVLSENPNEYHVAMDIMSFLQKELEITFPPQEIVFFTMFLCIEKDKPQVNGAIALLALAHGNGVARNMVDVANALLDTRHGHALDMSLHQSVDDFLDTVTRKVKEIDEGKGVLILVDMGSLLSFGEIITQKTGIPTKTIDMISTPFVLEALRKTMLSEYTPEDLYRELRSYTPYIGKLYSKEIKQKALHQYVIVTTCLSGEGAAVKLGELIRSAIPAIDEYHIDIVPCNTESFQDKHLENKRILAVVGARDLYLEDTLYISSDKIILEDGLATIAQIISTAVGVEDSEPVSSNIVMNNFLKESLVFLDPVKADDVIRKSFQVISKMWDIEDYNRILIGYMMHTGCMIERCIRGADMDYTDCEKRIKRNEKLYHLVRTAMKIIEREFQIRISDTEVAYIMDNFDTE